MAHHVPFPRPPWPSLASGGVVLVVGVHMGLAAVAIATSKLEVQQGRGQRILRRSLLRQVSEWSMVDYRWRHVRLHLRRYGLVANDHHDLSFRPSIVWHEA